VNNVTDMRYDINTLDELLDALDGPSGAAAALPELSPQAVCNWRLRGFIPPSRHLQVCIVVRKLGKSANPALFDRTEDDWRLLGMIPPDLDGRRARRTTA
jgi:hypothetical protein